MLERGKTSGRADDNIESIHFRFVEYENKTKPVLHFYEDRNILHPINGVGSIEDIFKDLCKTIDTL
jgi:adenylate kinase